MNQNVDNFPGQAAADYFEAAMEQLRAVRESEALAIRETAELCADRIAKGGLVFLFGAGHSRMMCEEMIPRQGCFVGFVAFVELAVSTHSNVGNPNGLRSPLFFEKIPGYAEELLKGYHFGPDDAFILISTSGIRPLIVEMALGAQKRGMPVVAITSVEHGRQVESTHESGKKLLEVADIVIDNHCPKGDCILELDGLDWRTGPVSTLTGAMIINMVRCETARLLLERGHRPEILPSHQLVANADANKQLDRFYDAYRRSLAHLYR